MEKDYYTDLEIPDTADEVTIRKAYHDLARRYHPDVDPSPEAEKKMKAANVAYATLSDPQKRAKYDLSRRAANKSNNAYQGPKSQQKEKPDFSEIIALEKQIQKYTKLMKKLENRINQYTTDIQNERNNIRIEMEELRRTKTSEESYQKALQYIEKFKKRDSNRFLSLTITQKQLDLYENCVKLYDQLEKQLKDWETEKIKEKIKPLEKRRKEKDEEYWNIFGKIASLEQSYYNHYLRDEYEEEKQKQETETMKK